MPFKYDCRAFRPKSEKYITSVIFSISRCGKHSKTLYFSEPLTEGEAISKAENYLSEPITKAYFDLVRDGLEDNELTFETLNSRGYTCRGDLLTDLNFVYFLDNLRRPTSNKCIL